VFIQASALSFSLYFSSLQPNVFQKSFKNQTNSRLIRQAVIKFRYINTNYKEVIIIIRSEGFTAILKKIHNKVQQSRKKSFQQWRHGCCSEAVGCARLVFNNKRVCWRVYSQHKDDCLFWFVSVAPRRLKFKHSQMLLYSIRFLAA
jgi:hypothetical protein